MYKNVANGNIPQFGTFFLRSAPGWVAAVFLGITGAVIADSFDFPIMQAAQTSMGAFGLAAGFSIYLLIRAAGGNIPRKFGLFFPIVWALGCIGGVTPLFFIFGTSLKMATLTFFSFAISGALGAVVTAFMMRSLFANAASRDVIPCVLTWSFSLGLAAKDDKSLVIASANPGEGKTLFAINMAILFASMGKKTVLVDADMRKPRTDKLTGIDRTPGLSDALIGEVQLSSIIKQVLLPNLYVIPAGTLPPNPSELLTNDRMDEFQQKFNKGFDIIIYDTPPMMSVTDSLILSKATGNTVLVIKGGETERKAVKHAAKQLEELDAKILGTVLNEVAMATARYYGKFGKYGKYSRYYRHYRRYYKYDYYYTEEGKRKKKEKIKR